MRRRKPHHHHHLPTVMAFLLLPLLLFLASADAAPPASDLHLLLSFKNALPNPGALPSWTSGGDPCSSFVGVSCDGHASGVVAVRLDLYPLRADFRHVVAYLLPLENLQLLSLRNTNLTGSLSAGGGGAHCSGELTQMDLSENLMGGSLMDVAAVASSCSGLKSLNVSGNALGFVTTTQAKTQPQQQQQQQQQVPVPPTSLRFGMEDLDLSYNKISGDSALSWLFQSGAGLLRRLDLRGNAISGTVPVVQNCSGLEYLDVSSNSLWQIAGGGVGALSSCEKLTFLNLSSNHFTGELPSELLGSCRSLVQLDLSFNNFSGTVPSGFSSCSVLKFINLSNNNFSGALPVETLTSMTSLERLELGYNAIRGKLMGSLVKLPNLQLLDLSSNMLTGSIPATLCDSPGVLALQDLFLQNNQLAGPIPTAIGNCSRLRSLDLSFNYLTGTLPTSLGLLTQLRDLIVWENALEGQIPEELKFLPDLENLFLDNNQLSGTIPDGLSNCTNLNWISLSSNRLTGSIPHWIGRLSKLAILKIGNNSLTGSIPEELGDCKSLIWLDLNSNQLSGAIPPTLGKQSGNIAGGLVAGKRYVYLRNDGSNECHGAGNLLEFSGIRQEGINRIPTRQSCNFTRIYMGSTQYTFNNNGSIIFLDMSYNQLEGEIPKELGVMYYLQVLNLGHNSLSGPIPSELGDMKTLAILDVSHNKLEGQIPMSLSRLTALSELDVSNNNLNGSIPSEGQLATFPPDRYENNSGLCGFPLAACGQNASLSGGQNQRSRSRQPSLAGSVSVGLLVSLLIIIAALVFMIEYKKRQKRKSAAAAGDDEARDVYVDSWSISGFANNSKWKFTSPKEALSISLAAFDKPLQKLTFADLLEATNGFHDDCLVGSGGFGDVYRAQLKDGSVVAIKKLIHVSSQGDKEFTAEMETIGRIKHRNLVPLLGYCKVKEERLLVYEYMKFGSLEDVLHDRKKTGIRLNWAARRKIAVGAARGLAFLHHSCIPHIIHRDMKSSNVLLDDELEARVSDFGMARPMNAMETHLSVSTLAGTPGYVPPEYYQSFRCSTKGDVYSYGVVLLELLTGKKPTDSSDFGDNVNLVDWVKQHSRVRITDVFDRELVKDDAGLELELLQHLKIACACLDERPMRRPTMLNVMAMLKEIQAGSTLDSSAVVSNTTNSVGGSFGSIEMGSLVECKEEKEL